MIEIKKLKQLIELMKENDLTELDVRDQEGHVTLKRGPGGSFTFAPTPQMMHAAPPQPQAPAAAPAGGAGATSPAAAADADAGLSKIASPMVGSYYSGAGTRDQGSKVSGSGFCLGPWFQPSALFFIPAGRGTGVGRIRRAGRC